MAALDISAAMSYVPTIDISGTHSRADREANSYVLRALVLCIRHKRLPCCCL